MESTMSFALLNKMREQGGTKGKENEAICGYYCQQQLLLCSINGEDLLWTNIRHPSSAQQNDVFVGKQQPQGTRTCAKREKKEKRF